MGREWEDRNLKHATGSGKTITAPIIKEHILEGGNAVVLVQSHSSTSGMRKSQKNHQRRTAPSGANHCDILMEMRVSRKVIRS